MGELPVIATFQDKELRRVLSHSSNKNDGHTSWKRPCWPPGNRGPVKSHINHLFTKTCVRGRAHAVADAFKHGFS